MTTSIFPETHSARYLRPFTRSDWECYAGCNSEMPLIAYGVRFLLEEDDDGITGDLIVDGKTVELHEVDDDGVMYGFSIDFRSVRDAVEWATSYLKRDRDGLIPEAMDLIEDHADGEFDDTTCSGGLTIWD